MKSSDSLGKILGTLQGLRNVDDPAVFVTEVEFKLSGLGRRIRLHVYCHPQRTADREFEFRLSHHIHTPIQAGPHIPSAPSAESADHAVEKGVRAITDHHESAVKEGHRPSEDWLKESSTW